MGDNKQELVAHQLTASLLEATITDQRLLVDGPAVTVPIRPVRSQG